MKSAITEIRNSEAYKRIERIRNLKGRFKVNIQKKSYKNELKKYEERIRDKGNTIRFIIHVMRFLPEE